MRGAIPPLPSTTLWRGTYLSTGTTLPLPLLVFRCVTPYSLQQKRETNEQRC